MAGVVIIQLTVGQLQRNWRFIQKKMRLGHCDLF